jgi:hypothetical protein
MVAQTPEGVDGPRPRRFRLCGLPDACGSTWVKGGAGTPVTVVSLPGRRAAGGRPQGRP